VKLTHGWALSARSVEGLMFKRSELMRFAQN